MKIDTRIVVSDSFPKIALSIGFAWSVAQAYDDRGLH